MSRSDSYILVVDDDQATRAVICEALSGEGYDPAGVANGEAALAHLRREVGRVPALILLDLAMPIMDGWQFAAAYRRQPPPHAPLVVMSVRGDSAEAAGQVGASSVLAKPFELSALLDVVSRFARPAPPDVARARRNAVEVAPPANGRAERLRALGEEVGHVREQLTVVARAVRELYKVEEHRPLTIVEVRRLAALGREYKRLRNEVHRLAGEFLRLRRPAAEPAQPRYLDT